MTKNKFPNGVKAALERAGIDQAELAREIGESRQQVGRWVHGERKLTFAVALKMSSVLGATPESLFTPPGMSEIIKAADLKGHKSEAQKDREMHQEMLSRFRALSVQTLAELAAEAMAEIHSRVSESDPPSEKTKRTVRGS